LGPSADSARRPLSRPWCGPRFAQPRQRTHRRRRQLDPQLWPSYHVTRNAVTCLRSSKTATASARPS
jgi:hypothetical protein